MKQSKQNNFLASDFYCTQCGSKGLIVWRQRGKEREAGHLKKLFCPSCGEEENCVEIKQNNSSYTFSDFIAEFEYGNFDKDGNRKMSYGKLRSKIHNGEIEKEKAFRNGGNSWIW